MMQQCFLAVIIAARPWGDGYPRLCLQKASHSHTADWCSVSDPRAFLQTILIWAVRFPGFEAHVY